MDDEGGWKHALICLEGHVPVRDFWCLDRLRAKACAEDLFLFGGTDDQELANSKM